ncbi:MULTISPECIES: hypothetical protein [unclassified Lactococcus]|uniref:hypothetical protein n=1 Tax=unclassified Lactococcus TaxID=2643510 RepID=UPI0011C9D8B8|nr:MULTISPECIES: hypothetical protein [unclassified Lactococcus]MQW24081.1 hypothetical protein [Lactococcus sp. dk101]TXK36730.1 hypothetical protein FVP42_10820 [Lactococcus sp. dk310]TXK46113.1 hypothetical protein FVP43_11115 [Lactococcus sp. dk322]
MSQKKVKFTKVEREFLDELCYLLDSADVYPEEKKKLIIAKELFEKGEYFPNVVRRIEFTFREQALRGGLSPEFNSVYTKIPVILRKTVPLGSNPGIMQVMPL